MPALHIHLKLFDTLQQTDSMSPATAFTRNTLLLAQQQVSHAAVSKSAAAGAVLAVMRFCMGCQCIFLFFHIEKTKPKK